MKRATAHPAPILPAFIPPMLARPGEAFDSGEYAFEVKWDGTRMLAFVDAPGRYRLLNRRRVGMTSRYPEFAVLGDLEPGTVLDGEIVMLRDGRPDFHALQSREHARNSMHIRFAAAHSPATFIAFDQLYRRFRPLLAEPYDARHHVLAQTVRTLASERVVLSEPVIGTGRAFFEAACEQGLEGIIAKRRSSPYTPGLRTGAWIKIKRQETVLCAIIGLVPEGRDDFASLLLAAERDGQAVYVGRVGSGFDAATRARLNKLLRPRVRPEPAVPCRHKGAVWVEPAVYCRVRCMERTPSGHLRAPVFVEICHGD
ncbi:MAG TPA: hypothetical protein VGI81_01710 [Tepidisphaeraceae bacterium]|jgi:DNA ligase D-like protein (predicted ligase)